jgi:DNA polymerase bacteriophage-type
MLQVTQQHLSAGAATATTTHVLHRDYETRSQATLKTIGGARYAAASTTEILCCCYAADDDPVKLWRPGDPIPSEFIAAAHNPNWIVAAFNDAFETAIEKSIMVVRYGWPVIPIDRHRCTQAMCLALGLPGRLSAAADALELEHRKDAAGERLMHQMNKPRRPHKDENPDGVYWFEDEERLDRLYSYCAEDVRVERELYNRLPPLSPTEQQLWQLSHQINVRGFHIDRAFAEAARKIAEAAAPEIDAEIAEITAGDVTTINQVAKLTAWLLDHGCNTKSH